MEEYVGFDVLKERTSFCVMDLSGEILVQGKAPCDPETLFKMLREHTLCPKRIFLETCTLSNLLARGSHYDEASGDLSEKTSETTVFPAMDKKTFGRT